MVNSVGYFVINFKLNNCFCWKFSTFSIYLHFVLMKMKSNPTLTVLTIVFGLLFLNYFLDSKNIFYVTLILSGLGVLSIRLSEIIEKLWFKLSYLLSQTIPNILLSVIFFLILTPIALLSRLFKSQTEFISKNNQNSMFIIKNKSFKKESFKRAW